MNVGSWLSYRSVIVVTAVCWSALWSAYTMLPCDAVCCSVLQCAAVTSGNEEVAFIRQYRKCQRHFRHTRVAGHRFLLCYCSRHSGMHAPERSSPVHLQPVYMCVCGSVCACVRVCVCVCVYLHALQHILH